MRTAVAFLRRTLAVAGFVLLAVCRPAGDQSVPQRSPERGVDLLSIDFMAVSADGEPVTDLKPEEITVRVGGRARTIRSLQFVSVAEAEDRSALGGDQLAPPFGTNAQSDTGRTLALIIDDDSFRPGRETPLRAGVDLLVRRLSSRDRLALVTMPYGGVKVPFTTDHSRVRTAVSRIVGNAPPGETGSQLACRTRETLGALAAFLETVGIRSEPSVVMFVTGALAAPRRDAPVTVAPGLCELRAELFTQVAVVAGAARAAFYVIRPDDVLERYAIQPGAAGRLPVQRENIAGFGYLGSDNPIEGIENLAGVTGGKLLHITGTPETAFGRVLRETSAYYVAAVTRDRNDGSGRSQELGIKVKRHGVELRARPRITFPSEASVAGRPTEPSPREMLAVATVFRDLPLRAGAFAALGSDGRSLRIVTIVEPLEPDVTLSALVAALFDADGKLVSQWTATADELRRAPVIGAMPAQTGGYRLRAAAIDSTGRSGTVDVEVSADVAQTGPLKLSSVVLGLSRAGSFLPRLQFTTEPVAIAYVELYGAAAGSRVDARLEIAATLNGPALVAVPLAIEAAGENRYIAKGAVPIGSLAPGDYSVRALVALEGHPMTRVVRTLRKAAR